MTPQELKNSILQLAVQGRLVEQRADEGTGEALFQRIQEERERLIRERKVRNRKGKKEKPLPEITEEELPFDIPARWKWVRLASIVEVFNGDRGKNYPAKATLSHEGIPFISALNLDGKSVVVDSNLLCVSEAQYEKLGNGKLAPGDIAVCIRGSLGKHGRYPFERGAVASSLAVLRQYLPSDTMSEYLMMYLDTPMFFSEIKKYDNGTAQPNLAAKSLKAFLVPLPPLREQERIVAKVEELLPCIARYERAWNRLEVFHKRFPADMRKSILKMALQGKLVEQRAEEGTAQTLLTRMRAEKRRLIKEKKIRNRKPPAKITKDETPFELPGSWRWIRFGDMVNYSIGKTPPRAEEKWWGGTCPWVSIADMPESGRIAQTKESVTEAAVAEKFGGRMSRAGTLLMSFKLTVGRVSILDIDAVHNEAIISIYPFADQDNIVQQYLFFVLPYITQYGDSKNAIKGKTLNNTSMSNLLIPLPPLGEQKRIVTRLEELLPMCERLK